MWGENYASVLSCVYPVLAGLVQTIWIGMGLLVVYAQGLGVPFIIMALLLNLTLWNNLLGRIRRYLPQLNAASAVLLFVLGLLVFSDNLILISNWITQTYGTGLVYEHFPA